eukprot:Colp12_sorted_trinity150504_noHs@6722
MSSVNNTHNDEPVAENPALLHDALVQGCMIAINAACAPGGAFSNAINRGINAACAPGGAFSNAINQACAPGGAFSNAINRGINAACALGGAFSNAINQSLALVEQTSRARLQNSHAHHNDSYLTPFPNSSGQMPPNFPGTVRALFALRANVLNSLLQHYNMPAVGTLKAKRSRLAAFLHVPRGL